MISHVMSDRRAQQIFKDLFIRCRKLNISLCFLTQSYFSVPKDVRLSCTHYILFKLNNKRELQNIAINHSADIDYKDFIKIHRVCRKEPFNFLTMILLKTINLLKILRRLVKKILTVEDKLKILDNKIRKSKADYDLYRKNTKISALPSGKLDKYEYLTGEDLGYRPDPVQKAKFEYSPLGQVLNKGLTTGERSEPLLKRLKNIEDKTDNQLRAIEGQKDNQLDVVKNQKTKQSDPIGKMKFCDEKLNKLVEDVIKKN